MATAKLRTFPNPLEAGKILVIVPTVVNCDVIDHYVQNATKHGFDTKRTFWLILTEDFIGTRNYEQQLQRNQVEGKVMDQADRESYLESMAVTRFRYTDVFPRSSHAETSFGLFYLTSNQEFEYGLFLDDDTAPTPDTDYFSSHIRNLNFEGTLNVLKSDRKWVNVLYNCFETKKLYPRGYPYAATGESLTITRENVKDVFVSQGLWTKMPDLDSIRLLSDGCLDGRPKVELVPEDYGENFAVAQDCFLTLCSMNLAFRREIIPAFYQFMMDDNPWKSGRFDDIWSGVVLKKVLDTYKCRIVSGSPLCEHRKTPRDVFKDLKREFIGLEANELFFRIVDGVELSGASLFEDSRRIATALSGSTNDFISYNGRYFLNWLNLLESLS